MIRHGTAPYLECSGEGYKPFSALYARIKARNSASIEFLYQTSKIIDGHPVISIGGGKGLQADNQEECNKLYSKLWDEYIQENLEFLGLIRRQAGLSDRFGIPGHCCQATELWRIRNDPKFPVDIPKEPII